MTAEPAHILTTGEVIEPGRSLHPVQFAVIAICFLCLILDGFDVQSIGYVAPAIIREWNIPKAELTPVFTAGLLGMLAGSFVLSWAADRIGRRPVLIAATLFFAISMLTTALASSIEALIAMRFITGLGLGGIMPNALALAGEFSPRQIRVTVMMIVATGFTLGAVIGGFVAVAMIDAVGWRSLFVIGGIAPFLLGLVMLWRLPESIQFRVRRGVPLERWRAELLRLRPDLAAAEIRAPEHPSEAPASAAVGELFAPSRCKGTFILWGLNFLNLIVLYFLSSWLPTLLAGSTLPQSTAIMAGTLVQIGGVIGTLTMGRLIDRWSFRPVLTATFCVAALALLLMAQLWSVAALYIMAFIAGFCIVGGQPALNSLAASFYPTAIRATGIGWSLGIGRIGSIVGPVLGGVLMGLSWSSAAILTLLAIPAAAASLLVRTMPPQARE